MDSQFSICIYRGINRNCNAHLLVCDFKEYFQKCRILKCSSIAIDEQYEVLTSLYIVKKYRVEINGLKFPQTIFCRSCHDSFEFLVHKYSWWCLKKLLFSCYLYENQVKYDGNKREKNFKIIKLFWILFMFVIFAN